MSMMKLQHLAHSVLGCAPHEKVVVEESFKLDDGSFTTGAVNAPRTAVEHHMEVCVSANVSAHPPKAARRVSESVSVPYRRDVRPEARQAQLADLLCDKLAKRQRSADDAATLARLGLSVDK